MQIERAKQVLGYAVLPGIVPRAKDLFGSGFGQLAFLMAYIFQVGRLLPANHPYLNPANIGKFTIRQVFAQAGSHLILSRRNIDQVIIFGAMMAAFILLVLQFIFLAFGLVIKPVYAQMFTTANPTEDIAFQLMDKVFGVPGFFNSSFAPTTPLPFQEALQTLFQFYSLALLLVAVIIFLYYVFVIIAETAQSGTPFGRRFNHVWAPIRLVVALGLLVPLAWGFNSGQYVVLQAAKMGSGFATNAWLNFNASLTNALGVDDNSLYIRPKVPDSWPLTKFMLLASVCREAYDRVGVRDIKPYLVKFGVGTTVDEVTPSYLYQDAVDFYDKRDVVIRFGQKGATDDVHGDQPGRVFPYCGEVIIYTTATTDGTGGGVGDDHLIGPWTVQEGYFNMIKSLWAYPAGTTSSNDFAVVMATRHWKEGGSACSLPSGGVFSGITCADGAKPEFFTQVRNERQTQFEAKIDNARTVMIGAGGLAMPVEISDRGWAGAGIWYNRIAEMNGAFSTSVTYLPSPNRLPDPLMQITEQRRKSDQNVSAQEVFTPHLSGGQDITFKDDKDAIVANVLYNAYEDIGDDNVFLSSDIIKKQNVILDTINYFFGLNGLFTIRENADIHPLAQLVGLGKGIIDSAIRSLFTATIFSLGGGIMSVFPDAMPGVGGFMDMASHILVTTATIGLSVGFILYYVLPFLPFMYFFFAVGSWLKTIFEAMVGVPLWALAHLRIDGDGLPGQSAANGYFMILEIFIRPILTVFGLIGSLIVFSAMAKVLNEVFQLVTDNLAGFDGNPCDVKGACDFSGSVSVDPANTIMMDALKFKRSVIDEFFFTVLYTIIVYMLATSAFKMIDQVPSQILRWIGGGIQVFSDSMKDSTEDLTQYAAIGGFTMTRGLTNAVVENAKPLAHGLTKLVTPSTTGAHVAPTKGAGHLGKGPPLKPPPE